MKYFREIKDLDELIKNAKELTTEARKDLPKSDFVFPKEERYPINDKGHAQNALARVEQHGTPAEKAKVKREVKKKYPDMKVKSGVKGISNKWKQQGDPQYADEDEEEDNIDYDTMQEVKEDAKERKIERERDKHF